MKEIVINGYTVDAKVRTRTTKTALIIRYIAESGTVITDLRHLADVVRETGIGCVGKTFNAVADIVSEVQGEALKYPNLDDELGLKKAPEVPKTPEKKEAPEVPQTGSNSRSIAVKLTWKDPMVAAKRAERSQVEVDGERYASTRQAFNDLGLPASRCIRFRVALKAAGKLTAFGMEWKIVNTLHEVKKQK